MTTNILPTNRIISLRDFFPSSENDGPIHSEVLQNPPKYHINIVPRLRALIAKVYIIFVTVCCWLYNFLFEFDFKTKIHIPDRTNDQLIGEIKNRNTWLEKVSHFQNKLISPDIRNKLLNMGVVLDNKGDFLNPINELIQTDEDRDYVLKTADDKGKYELLNGLVTKRILDKNSLESDITHAISKNDQTMMNLLLPFTISKDQIITPLHTAVLHGKNPQIVKILFQKLRAYVGDKDPLLDIERHKLISLAIQYNHQESNSKYLKIVKVLIKTNEDLGYALKTAARINLKMVNDLVNINMPIPEKDLKEAIASAVINNDRERLDLLLQKPISNQQLDCSLKILNYGNPKIAISLINKLILNGLPDTFAKQVNVIFLDLMALKENDKIPKDLLERISDLDVT